MSPSMGQKELYIWGNGKFGQLGTGNELDHGYAKISDRTLTQGQAVKDISCGYLYSIIVCDNGAVYSWGYGKNFQLGHEIVYRSQQTGSSHLHHKIPRKIKALNKIKVHRVSAGYTHSMALTNEGRVYTWGEGASGKLGSGNCFDRLEPTLVTMLRKKDEIIDLGTTKNAIRAMACGKDHSLILDEHGSVFSAGYGQLGALGHQNTNNQVLFTKIEDNLFKTNNEVQDMQPIIKICEISAGQSHSLAVDDSGRLFSWGSNTFGQLGVVAEVTHGTTSFADVTSLQRYIFPVVKGGRHSVGKKGRSIGAHIKFDASAGEGGDSRSDVRRSNLSKRFTKRSVFDTKLSTDKSLQPTQIQYFGRLLKSKQPPCPVKIIEDTPVIIRISCGGTHNLALAADGRVFSWGNPATGRLGLGGLGAKLAQEAPIEIESLSQARVVQLSAGEYHSLSLDVVGNIYIWGSNRKLQAGLFHPSLKENKTINIPTKSAQFHQKASKVEAGAFLSVVLSERIESDTELAGSWLRFIRKNFDRK